MLYGADMWDARVEERKMLSAFGRKCLRCVVGVALRDGIKNDVQVRTEMVRKLED